MDAREREIIRRNHRLLVHNIILTEEFFEHLRNYHVLPETMIRDVKKETTRENRNSKLLELLMLRGCDSFRKLRHILHLTGHCILADYLYGEDTDIKVFKPEDIFGKYPSIFSKVPDDVKMKLIRTIESKVKERSLLNVWERNPEERTELLETRRASFETEKILRFKLDNKRKQVRQISDEVRKLNEELRKRNIELELIKREENERKKAYNSELSVQAKFNAANSNSLLKLKDRFTSFNGKIRSINVLLKSFLGESSHVSSEEADNVKLTVLEHNVKLVIEKARENRDTTQDILDEKQSIYRLLNTFPKREEPLSDTVRKYLAKEDKGKKNLFKELNRLKATLGGPSKYGSPDTAATDLKLLSNMVATVRVEIEHLQKKLHWKENQISNLMDENTSLRQNSPSSPETPVLQTTSSHSDSPPSTPESTYEMQQAYENFDDYLEPRVKEYKLCLAISRDTTKGIPKDQKETPNNGSDVINPDAEDDNFPNSAADDNFHGVPSLINSKHAKERDLEELQSSRETPRSVAIRLDVADDKHSSNSLILPDIMETDLPKHPLLKSSNDFTKILEQSEDNDQLEKITSLLAKRTQFGKLPSIFQTVNYLAE